MDLAKVTANANSKVLRAERVVLDRGRPAVEQMADLARIVAEFEREVSMSDRVAARLAADVTEPIVYVRCSRCGTRVSNAVPADPTQPHGLIVRAWVECPECIERHGADPEPAADPDPEPNEGTFGDGLG